MADVFANSSKNWPLSRGNFGSYGRTSIVAVVERILTRVNARIAPQDKRKIGRSREVAVVERWPLVEARPRRN